jgi:hypothetical protein
VAEPRAERGPAEEREREVRVRLGGDGRGQVRRGEARAEPRDPRRELLFRRRADRRPRGGGLRVRRGRRIGGGGNGEAAEDWETDVAARGGGEQRHGVVWAWFAPVSFPHTLT